MSSKRARARRRNPWGGGRSRDQRGRVAAARLNQALRAARPSYNIRLKNHHFKQTFHPLTANFFVTGAALGLTYDANGVLTSMPNAGAAIDFFSYAFQLNDLPQVASYQAMFDSYRVNKIVLRIEPMSQPTHGVAATNAAALATILVPPTLFTVLDYDDTAFLASENAALEYDTYKETRPGLRHVRVVRPKLSTQAFKTSGTTIAFAQTDSRKAWIDMGDITVPYYFLKGGFIGYTNTAFQTAMHYRVYVTAYFSCRQLR